MTFFTAFLSFSIRFISSSLFSYRTNLGCVHSYDNGCKKCVAFCLLFSFGSTLRGFPSTCLTRCSCSSDRRFLISCAGVAIWHLVCSSSFKKLQETWKDTSLCFVQVEKSFHVAFGFSNRYSAFRCRYLSLSLFSSSQCIFVFFVLLEPHVLHFVERPQYRSYHRASFYQPFVW